MRVFVSSQAIDHWPARELVAALREAGVDVEHSPSNPFDRKDPRWEDWYDYVLEATMDSCDAFVVVLEPGWDSSTWMAIEAEAGLAQRRRTARNAYVWNPDQIMVKAAGMVGYLRTQLPCDLDGAVSRLRESTI